MREGLRVVADAIRELTTADTGPRLTVSTLPGFAVKWLFPRLIRFDAQHPEIELAIATTGQLADFSQGEADVAIRMHAPKQPDLVQRHLTALEWHVCASPEYLKQHGTPKTAEELDSHKLILFGDHHPPVQDINWLAEAGRRAGSPRKAVLEVNSLRAMYATCRAGLGITAIPDYMHMDNDGLVRVLGDVKAPKIDVYFVYPEELRNSKRVAVFRDFLLGQLAQR